MTKFLIKNCPAILQTTALCDSDRIFQPGLKYNFCKDINPENCPIKQIVVSCKETLDAMDKASGRNMYAGGRCVEADRVLQKLEIEEIENE